MTDMNFIPIECAKNHLVMLVDFLAKKSIKVTRSSVKTVDEEHFFVLFFRGRKIKESGVNAIKEFGVTQKSFISENIEIGKDVVVGLDLEKFKVLRKNLDKKTSETTVIKRKKFGGRRKGPNNPIVKSQVEMLKNIYNSVPPEVQEIFLQEISEGLLEKTKKSFSEEMKKKILDLF